MRLIDKINNFESGVETLSRFNAIFTNNPIFGFEVDYIVTIGEIDGPETTRLVTIDGTSFRHDFSLVESDRKFLAVEDEDDEF